MQVQLIVTDNNRSGQVIPVNVPSFTIGRADGCNLRSHSANVSRHHCTIQTTNDGLVMILDLGGENGTFVNGSRITTLQPLRNGDKLVVGTHKFVVRIDTETAKLDTNPSHYFELPAPSATSSKSEDSQTSVADPRQSTAIIQETHKPEPVAEVMFEIRLEGQRVSVSKARLFELARRGSILPDDLIVVAGTKIFADSVQGIVFGDKSSAPTPPPLPPQPQQRPSPAASAPPTSSVEQTPPTPPVVASMDIPDLGGLANELPFDNLSSGPVVRAARKEGALKSVWKALDISFSRVYTIEGNDLVIHSIKALYYIIVVVCLLGIFWMWFDVAEKCYKAENALTVFSEYFLGLAVVTFGCVTIIVVVRILIEMLLLAWVESAKQER